MNAIEVKQITKSFDFSNCFSQSSIEFELSGESLP